MKSNLNSKSGTQNLLVLSVSKKHVGGMYHALQSLERSLVNSGKKCLLVENTSYFGYLKIFFSRTRKIIIWSFSHEASLLPLITSQIIGIRNIYFNHGVWHLESQVSTWFTLGPLSLLKRKFHYFTLQLKQVMVLLFVSEVIHPSKYASQLFWSQKLNRIFINRRKSVVLPLTVDSSTFKHRSAAYRKKVRCNYGITSKEKVILMIGRADNRKNVQEGLLLLKKLLPKHKNIQFLYVFATSEYSDYSYISFLSNVVGDLQVGRNVKFLTGLSADEIPEAYQIADICLVLPLHSEMFGLTTLESLYSGTPVFGYWSSATPEIIQEEKGMFLVPVRHIDDLARRVENYLYSRSVGEQERTRKKLAQKARGTFNDSELVKKLVSYYPLL